jgi:hypothetical protein
VYFTHYSKFSAPLFTAAARYSHFFSHFLILWRGAWRVGPGMCGAIRGRQWQALVLVTLLHILFS